MNSQSNSRLPVSSCLALAHAAGGQKNSIKSEPESLRIIRWRDLSFQQDSGLGCLFMHVAVFCKTGEEGRASTYEISTAWKAMSIQFCANSIVTYNNIRPTLRLPRFVSRDRSMFERWKNPPMENMSFSTTQVSLRQLKCFLLAKPWTVLRRDEAICAIARLQAGFAPLLPNGTVSDFGQGEKRRRARQEFAKGQRAASGFSLDSMNWYDALWQTFDAYTPQGKTLSWSHTNVLSLLAGIFFAGGCIHDFIQQLRGKFPSSKEAPWRCALYSDEVHPGHQLSSNSRKCWAMYFGFWEHGKELSREDVWLPKFMCRSALVNQLASSIGQCFKAILETMFSNPLANPLTGVKLKSSTGNNVIELDLVHVLAGRIGAEVHVFQPPRCWFSNLRAVRFFLAKVAHDFSLADEVKESQPSLHKFRKLAEDASAKDWSSKEWVERLQWPCFAFHETEWTTATSAMFTILPWLWLYACPLFQRGFGLHCFLVPRWIVVQWAAQCLEDTVWIFATLDPTSPIFCSKIKECWRTQGQEVFQMQCQ